MDSLKNVGWRRVSSLFALLVFILLVPRHVWAGYAHEDCPICHGNRLGVGLAILTKDRQLSTINPNTGKPLQRIEAICLSCHSPEPGDTGVAKEGEFEGEFEDELEDSETKLESSTQVLTEMMLKPVDVGFRVVDLHRTHPVGIVPDPNKVVLPPEAKGFKGQEDQLTCLGCHNHHPSNPNYKYLRWPADKGKNINKFCAHCHPDKGKREGIKRRKGRRGRGGGMIELPP